MLVVGVAVVFLLVGIGLAISSRAKRVSDIGNIDEITVSKGGSSISLNRKGVLTVKIPEGTFQQQWDERRTADFFSKFEKQDFSRFSSFGPEEGGYVLTIVTGDGQTITLYLPSIGVDIPDEVEELIEELEDIEDSVAEPTPTPEYFGSVTMTPTPPPIFPTSTPTPASGGELTPTPTPSQGSGSYQDEDYLIPFVCEFLDPEIRPDILSETLCTPQ
jgi:hypothetical protein